MKTKTSAIITILIFSFLSAGSAFGKTKRLSDLEKLNRSSFKANFMKNVIDADSISRVFDAAPANDYEQFKMKLAPDAGSVMTRRYKAAPATIKSQEDENKKKRPRLRDFSIFGSDKKEL